MMMCEEDDVEEEDRSQDREAHFVRACAGDMRMDISQEPFCKKCYRKNGRGHLRCASLRSRNAHGHVTRGILCGNLQGKCRTRIPRPVVWPHSLGNKSKVDDLQSIIPRNKKQKSQNVFLYCSLKSL